mmetsp:Transcript_58592/g.168225  ORF Transcript_58592/g.168225 Transcript_58592/m.168225 type:complete len:518 (+) Transcript_58592:181-1734(+)
MTDCRRIAMHYCFLRRPMPNWASINHVEIVETRTIPIHRRGISSIEHGRHVSDAATGLGLVLLTHGPHRGPRCCLQLRPHLLRASAQGALLVAAVVCHGIRPRRALASELVGEKNSCRHEERGRVAKALDVHHAELQHVLGEGPLRGVAVVRACEPAQKVPRCGRHDLEVKRREDGALHASDRVLGVGVVGDVGELRGLGDVDLLELRCDQHARHANELQPAARDQSQGEVAVDQILGQEESLGSELVPHVHLHQPIEQDTAHPLVEVCLPLQVIRPGHELRLVLEQVLVDLLGILADLLHVHVVQPEGRIEGRDRGGVRAGNGRDDGWHRNGGRVPVRWQGRRGTEVVVDELLPRGRDQDTADASNLLVLIVDDDAALRAEPSGRVHRRLRRGGRLRGPASGGGGRGGGGAASREDLLSLLALPLQLLALPHHLLPPAIGTQAVSPAPALVRAAIAAASIETAPGRLQRRRGCPPQQRRRRGLLALPHWLPRRLLAQAAANCLGEVAHGATGSAPG